MKIFRNKYIPFRRFSAINLFGVLVVHHDVYLSRTLMNHERIHTAQMRELGYVFFYVLYLLEWLMKLPFKGNAYRRISFEREAYAFERDYEYLERRRHYAWCMFVRRDPRPSVRRDRIRLSRRATRKAMSEKRL
jgi:hypothetical protein